MDKNLKKSFLDAISLPQPDPDDLRGRQSVRATFKLSSRSIEALTIVAVHLGIKQKSLFDHLIEDMGSLDLIAQEVEAEVFNTLDRVQKTYVISRRTLSSLEETCSRYDAPRDALVEYSIQRLLPVIRREREKHRQRKEILKEITANLEQGLQILNYTKKTLGEEDPVYQKLEAALAGYVNAHDQIGNYIERGSAIEDF